MTVEGFRGIGEPSRLSFTPGPGLVVVAGRNGCGKSSFAEGLEVALTRGSYRWRQRQSVVWHESWRNLHHTTSTAITVELAEAGAGPTMVAATWGEGAALDDATSWVQRRGAKRQPGLEALGWSVDLELHRPFLSYDELGALFAEPSKLHAALSSILGLRRIEDAQKRLAQAVKTLAEPKEAAARLAKDLKPELAEVADPRAAVAAAQLRKTKPDLAAVRALVAGNGTNQSGDLTRLRVLADVPPQPADPATFTQAVGRYERAATALDSLDAGIGAVIARKSELLASALLVHAEQGDGPCPVCGQGALDAAWAARVTTELEREREVATARADARRELTAAEKALQALVVPVPAVLTGAPQQTGEPEPPAGSQEPGLAGAVTQASSAWQRWAHLAEDPAALARDGGDALTVLTEQVGAVRLGAREEFQRREDAWQPVAVRLAQWLGQAEAAHAQHDQLAQVKAAAAWLKDHAHHLRNDRIRPLAERARRIWAQLRQESNVDLGEITLAGTNTRRRVELTASVDGAEARALAVMSQGELHALALALFLPKATTAGSPFGFVVIDDPVQAMDPAKVDGLARVLAEVAAERQVIVFTHDDRLPEAVRRLNIPARLVEVTRNGDSRVAVGDLSDPARRYLDDARAVALDDAVPDIVRRQVIPELCRMAVEARCRDLFFGRRLRAGARRDDVESTWAAAVKARSKVALAVHGDSRASLEGWLGGHHRRRAALGICSTAPHTGLNGDPRSAIDDVTVLLTALDKTDGR